MFVNQFWLVVLCILVISGCSSRNSPAPVVESKTPISLNNSSTASINGTVYRVKKGETLYSIAWRANTDIRTLAKLNNLSAPYKIFPDQKLLLVRNSTQASSNKPSAKKSTKSSGITSSKEIKKPIASNKKPAYGGVVSGQKTSKKPTSKATTFSQKIREWRWPASGKVISTFSTALQGNKGIDIAGRRGDKIRVAASGTVVYAGNALRGYGNLIIVKHNDDYLSAYAHNDKILVKEDQVVNVGDVIGRMGDTDAKRVMLHFEVRFRGKSVNPQKYLPRK